MKQLLSLTLVFAGFSFSMTGCGGDSATTLEPEAAVEAPELSAEEQAQYDKEMAAEMGGN